MAEEIRQHEEDQANGQKQNTERKDESRQIMVNKRKEFRMVPTCDLGRPLS